MSCSNCLVEVIILQIELLEVLIPVEEYRVMRVKFMEMRAEQRKLHAQVKKLKAKNEPAHTLLKSVVF
jgi:hypothetical protein